MQNNPINYIDPYGLVLITGGTRIGKWGLKQLGKLSRDEARRQYRKEGKDIVGSKKMLKKLSKNKGKGKTGQPIYEKHGEGYSHWHTPDRKTVDGLKKGGHGFVLGSLLTFFSWLDYIDPIEILVGETAGSDLSMIPLPERQNCE